jgi:hypothetical protein
MVELPKVGAEVIRYVEFPALSIIFVAVQDADAPVEPAPELGVPAPVKVNPTPLGMDKREFHVQVPDGTLIVSPLTTLCVGPLITAFTSE